MEKKPLDIHIATFIVKLTYLNITLYVALKLSIGKKSWQRSRRTFGQFVQISCSHQLTSSIVFSQLLLTFNLLITKQSVLFDLNINCVMDMGHTILVMAVVGSLAF